MSDKTLTENDDDEELVVVEVDEIPDEPKQAEAEPEEDEESDEDDESDEDSRLSEDLEESGEKPKLSRAQKLRNIRKKGRERTYRELDRLRQENEAFKKRLAAVEGSAIDHNVVLLNQQIEATQREIRQAELILAKAIEAGNGEDAAQALKLRDEALSRQNELTTAKGRLDEAKKAPSGPDPRTVNYLKEWVAANPWYKPDGSDEASAITNAIDRQLSKEGYDPSTEDYWHELTARVSARFGNSDEPVRKDKPAARKKAPPLGSTREHVPQSTRKEVYVTPERKQAMIDAGIWDDPVRRNQMLKAYADYDRQSAR